MWHGNHLDVNIALFPRIRWQLTILLKFQPSLAISTHLYKWILRWSMKEKNRRENVTFQTKRANQWSDIDHVIHTHTRNLLSISFVRNLLQMFYRFVFHYLIKFIQFIQFNASINGNIIACKFNNCKKNWMKKETQYGNNSIHRPLMGIPWTWTKKKCTLVWIVTSSKIMRNNLLWFFSLLFLYMHFEVPPIFVCLSFDFVIKLHNDL